MSSCIRTRAEVKAHFLPAMIPPAEVPRGLLLLGTRGNEKVDILFETLGSLQLQECFRPNILNFCILKPFCWNMFHFLLLFFSWHGFVGIGSLSSASLSLPPQSHSPQSSPCYNSIVLQELSQNTYIGKHTYILIDK